MQRQGLLAQYVLCNCLVDLCWSNRSQLLRSALSLIYSGLVVNLDSMCLIHRVELSASLLLQAEGYDKGLEQRVNNLEAIVSQLQK